MKKCEYSVKIVEEGRNYKSLRVRRKIDYYISEEIAALCFFGIPEFLRSGNNSHLQNNYKLIRETFSGKGLGKFGKRDLKNLERRLPGRHIEIFRLNKV